MRLVDLDDPVMLERAIDEFRSVHAIRQIDPRLRGAIERRADESAEQGRLTESQRKELQRQLDAEHPELVLERWFGYLIPHPDIVARWWGRQRVAA